VTFRCRYDGFLLRKAAQLGKALAKAFVSPTGIPHGRCVCRVWRVVAHVTCHTSHRSLNLRGGVVAGESNFTATATAGTLLLEFSTLSRLTRTPTCPLPPPSPPPPPPPPIFYDVLLQQLHVAGTHRPGCAAAAPQQARPARRPHRHNQRRVEPQDIVVGQRQRQLVRAPRPPPLHFCNILHPLPRCIFVAFYTLSPAAFL